MAADLWQAFRSVSEEVIEDLVAACRIPAIRWPGIDQNPVEESALLVAEHARAAGFDDVEILRSDTAEVSGAPAVVARHAAAPGFPTVLLYAHHDVQPIGDLSAWQSKPFEPEERNGRLYGRGTADDKAGIYTHLGALRTLSEAHGTPGNLSWLELGVTLFIEGEEEAGSPTFSQFLSDYRDKLEADVIVVADSSNWTVDTPAISTSLRGLVALKLTVEVLERPAHSGMFGGPVLDALTVLMRLVSSLHDQSGDVAIPGLRSGGTTAVDYTEEQFRQDVALLPRAELVGTGSITERLWRKPALSVIGVDAPSVAESSNILIPKASAKLSLRISPEDSADSAAEALVEALQERAPFGVSVVIEDIEKGPAFDFAAIAGRDSMTTSAQELYAHAVQQAWGVPLVEIGQGGSIPFIADFQRVFPDAEILVTGVEDPDSRAHSPNESLDLAGFHRGIVAQAGFLLALGRRGTAS